MSMVEVGYELRGRVEFLVGSEGFVLNTGWPYHRILGLLKQKPAMQPQEFAEAIVKKYISYYVDYEVAGASTDMSVCNLGQFEETLKPIIENWRKRSSRHWLSLSSRMLLFWRTGKPNPTSLNNTLISMISASDCSCAALDSPRPSILSARMLILS